MDRLKSNFYTMEYHTYDKLKSFGFTYNKEISDSENEFYSYKFPVYEYNGKPLLNCMISVESRNGTVIIDVYDTNLEQAYAPFYNNSHDYDKILLNINDVILEKLDILGIKEVLHQNLW